MHTENPEYEIPSMQVTRFGRKDVVKTSADFDEGQSGLSF